MARSVPNFFALAKVWLLYAAVGILFGSILRMMGGDESLPLSIAMSAIFVAIGAIIVGTAVWGVLKQRRHRDGVDRPHPGRKAREAAIEGVAIERSIRPKSTLQVQ